MCIRDSDTIADKCSDHTDYQKSISVKTEEGYELILKGKSYYDEKTHTDVYKRQAVSLKKGDLNTPSVFLFLKKKTAALIIIPKPPLGRLYSVRRVKTLPPNNVFFYFPLDGSVVV